ncbi:MAG: DUF3341 domain-containing protein [Novosphingobium sp.]|nr:DUF3341 domain-containing protein [Novosphingobium sp.]
MSERPLYALLGEFGSGKEVLAAAKAMRRAGCGPLDAFTPFPVDGLAEALGFSDCTVQTAAFVGGVVGAAAGFAMQMATNLDFPLWIGGRPLIAVPAFMLICFELLVLGAVLGAIGAMFVANRLPRLNHPMFEAPEFGLGSDRRFFLAVLAGPGFDRARAGRALAKLKPRAIIEVPEVG